MPEKQTTAPVYVPPRDPWELQLVQLWEELLPARPIGVTNSFFDLGGHSMLALRLLGRIEQTFKQALPVMRLFQATTIAELAQRLRSQSNSAPPTLLLPMRKTGQKRPFFCIHPVSGQALCYLDLVSHLDLEQPFYGLQAVGLYDEQQPLYRLEAMAARYLEEICRVQSQGPYLLGGWSFGSLVSLEMAQQLQARGQQVGLLALLDPRLPGRLQPPESNETDDMMKHLQAAVKDYLDHELPVADEALMWLGSYDWRTLREQIDVVPAEQIRRLLRVYTANYQTLSSYQPAFYPGRVTLFLAQEHTAQTRQAIIRYWQDMSADVKMYTIPGTHQTIIRKPHVRFLARTLQESLNNAF